ncbi:MAG TPA: PqqD family protein [Anaerolineales bacterium]|nr:PqqD family protein [Anaerolineales bacterium]
MLTLDAKLQIPSSVSFTFVDEDAILLNMHTNQYYLLDEVGARLLKLLKDGKTLRASYQLLLEEYEVTPAQLEQDILELLDGLKEQGLVEVGPA